MQCRQENILVWAEYAWANIERYIGKTIEDVNDESLSLASPVHYISEDMPPILLQHGDVDKLCPVSQSWEFYHETVSAVDEDRVTIEILNDADHADHAFENGRKYDVTVATSDGLEQIIIRGQGCIMMSARELREEMERISREIREEYVEQFPGSKNLSV